MINWKSAARKIDLTLKLILGVGGIVTVGTTIFLVFQAQMHATNDQALAIVDQYRFEMKHGSEAIAKAHLSNMNDHQKQLVVSGEKLERRAWGNHDFSNSPIAMIILSFFSLVPLVTYLALAKWMRWVFREEPQNSQEKAA